MDTAHQGLDTSQQDGQDGQPPVQSASLKWDGIEFKIQ